MREILTTPIHTLLAFAGLGLVALYFLIEFIGGVVLLFLSDLKHPRARAMFFGCFLVGAWCVFEYLTPGHIVLIE